LPQVEVQGVAGAAWLIQVNLRRQPWRGPAFLAGGAQIEVGHGNGFGFSVLGFREKIRFSAGRFYRVWGRGQALRAESAAPPAFSPIRKYECQVDYLHDNPVKNGQVARVADWPYSSFHRHVERGIYPLEWAADD
jgi:hypothetical protein